MGFVFDSRTADMYAAWCASPQGRAMDRFLERAVLRLLDPQPGEKILDIGCGEGNHLLFFKKLGLDIYGVDPSPFILERARGRLGHRHSLQKARAEDLPFSDNDFDLAIMVNTLEFLDDPLLALKEAGRVARRAVFLGVMNHFSWFWISQKTMGLFRESPFSRARFYNLWELKSYVHRVFGDTPVTWTVARSFPSNPGSRLRFIDNSATLRRCPVGLFLGASIPVRYWMQSLQHPLKIGLKKAKHPLVQGVTRSGIHPPGRVGDHEGRLSL